MSASGGVVRARIRRGGNRVSGPEQRIRRLGESVQIVGRLLEGEELDFDGEHYK